jgi:cystathionine beta-lyase
MTDLPVTKLGSSFATSRPAHEEHFDGHDDLLALWIAEPYLPLAPPIVSALQARAAEGWYGYEERPAAVTGAFSTWMQSRHGWDTAGLALLPSPSIGVSIGVLLDLVTSPEDGVIVQPPVFTDFKPSITRSDRAVARSPLILDGSRYEMDLEHLATVAAEPNVTSMILCNPHNPVGRVWSQDTLRRVAEICAEHDVFVIADEIHADLTLGEHRFTPFASVARTTGVRWAALHGPIKTFGVAGVCDTLLITDDERAADGFATESRRLHLTRKNVFGLTAFQAGYESGGEWLDQLLTQISSNVAFLQAGLPESISLIEPEATYLGWLDMRGLGMDVPDLASWLPSEAGIALSPGHWFGREGAGFGRLSIGVEPSVLKEAVTRLQSAVARFA